MVAVDPDVEANNPDDKIQCGPIPTPFEFEWYYVATASAPCPRITMLCSVRVKSVTGKPIVGAAVMIPGVPSPVLAGVDGSFTIHNVPVRPKGTLCIDNSFQLPRVDTALGDITLGDDISIT